MNRGGMTIEDTQFASAIDGCALVLSRRKLVRDRSDLFAALCGSAVTTGCDVVLLGVDCDEFGQEEGSSMEYVVLRSLFGLIGIVLLAGCATITRGTGEVLVVETEPAGATVAIQPGNVQCKSPCSVELKRKKDYKVAISKEGYETVNTDVLSQIVSAGAAGMAGNVLLGGIIGLGVGGTKGLKPNPVRVTLSPIRSTPSARGSTSERKAPQVNLSAVPIESICDQPSLVDRQECLGTLRKGMTMDQVLQLLGAPDGRSGDGQVLRYQDRYLKFDSEQRLTRIEPFDAVAR
jgi:hypothetical protein